jgi:glycosyltransferase involved in cell wall biosynthesis
MKWLIAEDALRNDTGHWVDYIETIKNGLVEAGDEVFVLADRDVEVRVKNRLNAHPALPNSIWHRMSDGSSALIRYARVPMHAWDTFCSVRRWLRKLASPDFIFVPTVYVHHLLGWYWLLKSGSLARHCRLLLFFPNLPLNHTEHGARWVPGWTSKAFAALFHGLRSFVESGQVVLGAETQEMQSTLSLLTGLEVVYLPHPVSFRSRPAVKNESIRFSCFGAAREEKGSDILQLGISEFLGQYPGSRARFSIQWINDFADSSGRTVSILPSLLTSEKVEYIRRFFVEGEYAERLAATDVMVLPYRTNAYETRISRVVIEAMMSGIPVITTAGTTLARQAEEFGANLSIPDGDVTALVDCLNYAVNHKDELTRKAICAQQLVAEHFSVKAFRDLLLQHTGNRKPSVFGQKSFNTGSTEIPE